MRSCSVVVACLMVLAGVGSVRGQAARPSAVQRSYEGDTNVIQKDYQQERWSITYRRDRGDVVGNVFFEDGRDPMFLSCGPVAASDEELTYRCRSAGACTEAPCSVGAYRETAEPVGIEPAFFFPPGEEPELPFVSDFSVFTDFEFERQPAFGFCPPADAIFAARLTRSGDTSIDFSATILEEDEPGPGCLEGLIEDRCLRPVELPVRSLSPEEASRVTTAFASVVILPDPDPICEVLAIDPCYVNRLSWEDVFASEYPCSAPRVDGVQARELIDLLEGLVAR